MKTSNSNGTVCLTLPFIGREREAAQLQRLHAQRKHTLILGAAGVGKTALVEHVKEKLLLLVCPQSEQFSSICESLEAQLGLESGDSKLRHRKQQLLRVLAGRQRTVVFDGVSWTTPKLSSFLECVMARAPMWICARSEHPWDIGHFWPLLVRFERVELRPFRPAETRECVAASAETGLIPREALGIVEWLHHRSRGSPRVLRELFQELAAHGYDLSEPHALRRLDLDRRIHEMFPAASGGQLNIGDNRLCKQ